MPKSLAIETSWGIKRFGTESSWCWNVWGPIGCRFTILFPIYGYPKFIFGHLKMYFWISIIHFWISKNPFMDILKYMFGYQKISWLLDIHSSIFGYPKMNNGYPKMHPEFLDIHKSIFGYPKSSWILDINNSIYGYPNMNYGYPKIHPDYWISINQILDIQKSVEYWISIIQFLDIQKIEFWIS